MRVLISDFRYAYAINYFSQYLSFDFDKKALNSFIDVPLACLKSESPTEGA